MKSCVSVRDPPSWRQQGKRDPSWERNSDLCSGRVPVALSIAFRIFPSHLPGDEFQARCLESLALNGQQLGKGYSGTCEVN